MTVRVACYAGRRARERPIRFYLDDREYLVEDILDQWYGPVDTGNEDERTLVAFRRS
jgi:hypothetical protein